MEIKLNGSRPSVKGPGEYFTGNVRVDPLFNAPDPSRTSGAYVTFEPCSRSNWHTHPLGQTLIVTAGCGRAQRLKPHIFLRRYRRATGDDVILSAAWLRRLHSWTLCVRTKQEQSSKPRF